MTITVEVMVCRIVWDGKNEVLLNKNVNKFLKFWKPCILKHSKSPENKYSNTFAFFVVFALLYLLFSGIEKTSDLKAKYYEYQVFLKQIQKIFEFD